MIGFYKKYVEYISEHATDPDKLSRVNSDEAPRHFIDIDNYGENPFDVLPKYWKDALGKYPEDSLLKHGVLPWHISNMLFRLTNAFETQDVYDIIKQSAFISHYIADATVPLHTTIFYNGRKPEQKGIHAFWETRIPELYAQNFDFLVGRAIYIKNGQLTAWDLVQQTHAQVDSVYMIYDKLIASTQTDKVFVYDSRGTTTKKDYSREFAATFERESNKMIERNMRRAILYVASFWYTAWVNGGQPDLAKLVEQESTKRLKDEQKTLDEQFNKGKALGRPNPEDEN